MAEKPNTTAQTLSLPKGGGAIKGIGETFRPDLFTGTGNFSVSIYTSPGRNGFGPKLTLDYSTGNGNSPFGLGWSLSIPRVTRKTEKGLPRYDNSDVFVLSGAEDLVPTDPPTRRDSYTITSFRPRTEGLFSRIERWEDDNADVHWRAITKDNVTSIYGKTASARLADPANPRRVYEWLLQETFDARGNHMLYEYSREDPTTVPPAIYEDNRVYTQLYIRRIFYGNTHEVVGPHRTGTDHRDPLAEAERHYLFEVFFDYGDLVGDSNANVATGPVTADWFLRPDPFSTYRSGFEIRTLRRCRRIIMYHHAAELGGAIRIKSTNFAYDSNPDTLISFLASVTLTGYRWVNGAYQTASLPPVTFRYSTFRPTEQRYQSIQAKGNAFPPLPLSDPDVTLVDLFGKGLPDLLHTTSSGFRYWKNVGGGVFDRPRTMPRAPAGVLLSQGDASFADLAGDGRADLLVLNGSLRGFYETTPDGDWLPLRLIQSTPSLRLDDLNARLLDLTGNGLTDVLVTRERHFLWYECLGEGGYAPPQIIPRVYDLNEFPDVSFDDPSGRVRLADMNGDGLLDIVLLHNGRIDYWPNLGYGRFGTRITMAGAPRLERDFDAARLFLADLDGSGCADLAYVESGRVRFWFNRSGNSWSDEQVIYGTPDASNQAAIRFADFYGTGTTALVWSYPLNRQPDGNYKVLDFCGGIKPYLLVGMDNNMGATTRVEYATSTRFYLEDEAASKPWITRLSFPVQVVAKVEIIDHVSRMRLATTYRYHHGYYDGHEREFRGFGMVEQQDTEAFEDYVVGVKAINGTQELERELYQPPVITRNWFHTGAFLGGDKILHQLREEYYRQEQFLPESTLPTELDVEELRECMRALRGLPLRQEVYSFDGTPQEQHPYRVVENNYEVRLLQPRGAQQHAVFFSVGRESVSLNYERNPADPRIVHSLNLEIDQYGNALKSCSVVYGRKIADPSLPAEVTRDQQHLYITYSEADYTPDIDRDNPTPTHLLRVPYETKSYEITGIAPAASLFQLAEIKAKIDGTTKIPYERVATGAIPQKRLLSHSRALFLDNNLKPLPLGQWDTLALRHESYQLAFTPGVTKSYYAGKIADTDFSKAGYVHFNGDSNWWIPSGTAIYPADPANHFYIPIGTKDPLGIETIATFDKYDLLVERVQVKQATWNEVTAVNDYRVLGPVLITDPNKNRSAVEIDALGMVVKSAVMGKAGSGDGDTLGDPTVRMEYELFNWMNNKKPNFVRTFAREQHGAANPRWQESYAYSNGSGGVALVKTQAHPGKAFKVNPDGTKTEVDADPRWVGNGRTILTNKGNPVKQYEPYFSITHEYEDEKVLREIGATPILYYDAVGRNIRTLFPNGTFARVEFDSWMQKVFDANDTVKESQWYTDRGSPDPATQPEPLNDPERRAAWLAAKHADTPGKIHFDSLGRPFYAVSDYGGGKKATVRSKSDLTGRFSRMFDQHQREVASGFTGMAGHPIFGESAEKGRRWIFQNVLGALVHTWDEHGREFHVEYDDLHRPLSTFAQEAGQAKILFNYVVYGDRHPNAEQLNLLGTAYQVFDQAGMVRVPELDFKGNPKRVERVLARDYDKQLDWTALDRQPDLTAIQTTADAVLEIGEVFTASSQYDALNRPTQVTLPDNTVIVPTYNEANFLASLKAQIRGQGNFIDFLKDQDYDAKGQRQFAHYGNEVFTRYFYDPNTFRLTNLLTYKSGEDPNINSLQDLHYAYDPVGNITQIRDDAQQTHYFSNAVVKPESLYEYDAIYQLIRATGREHAGLGNDAIRTHTDLDFVPQLPHANNASAVRTYTEEYEYDLLGNIKKLRHHWTGNGWTRRYRYAYEDDPTDRTNRLRATSLPGDPDAGPYSATYDYDTYGNMTRMPHLATMDWNFRDQLWHVDLGGGGTAYYVYGLGGQRLRKVIERNGNTKLEWIYFGPVVIFRRRRRDTNELRLERWTVHISDNTGHIAQVDTKTRDDDNSDPANPLNTPLIRYQYANHLGSAVLETDENGNPISYEEYHPYGTTSYRSAKSGFDLSLKQYRFSGKERDDETGLYYFGARYYAAWLGRWTSGDPAGFVDGLNLYLFARNNPANFVDKVGFEALDTRFQQGGTKEDRLYPESTAQERFEFLQRRGKTLDDPDISNDKWVGDREHGHWDLGPDASVSPKGGGSSGATKAGSEAIKRNPKGFTLEVGNNFDDAKIAPMEERIRTDRGIGHRSVGPDGSRTDDIRARYEGLRNQYNKSLPPDQRASRATGTAVDHTVELQYIIRGNQTAGADTVRPQDHRIQDAGINSSQGRTGRTVADRQIATGVPEDVPAGGVARTRDIGRLVNRQGFRTGMRWGGYGLMIAGPALTTYGALQADNLYVKGGGLGAAAVEAGGVGYYFYGRVALGGAKGFAAGQAAMNLGGRVALGAGGVGQALLSGYLAVGDFQRGDWRAFGFDAAAALGGVALIVAAVISAPALAAFAIGLAIFGIATGIAAGVFHAGRYFGWWN